MAPPRAPVPPRKPTPSEGDEPAPKKPLILWIILGGCGVAVVALILMIALKSKPKVIDDTAETSSPTPTAEVAKGSSAPSAVPTASADDEAAARELFESAEKIDHGDQIDHADEARDKYHEVSVHYPFSTWAKKADQKSIELENRLKAYFEKEFEAARKTAADLVAAGKIRQAIESLRQYVAAASKDILKRRAESEITTVENDARSKYNDAMKAAVELVKKGSYDPAIELLKKFGPDTLEEIASAATKDMERIREGKNDFEEYQKRHAAEVVDENFRKGAKALLEKARLRKYDDVVKAFDAAIKEPANAPIKTQLEQERAIVVAAAAFWDGLQKGLKARLNQEVTLQLADGKFAKGTLKKIGEDRVTLKVDEAESETTLDKLHNDQLLLLAIGKGALPEAAGETYARAAMWFFLEGKHDLSKLELATAKDLGFAIDGIEKAWREGYFRYVMSLK